MGVKMYTPEARVSKTAAVERVCSHCQRTWLEEIKIEATGRGASSYFTPDEKEAVKAKENAYKQLKQKEETEKKALGVDKRVLCPSCGHFSTGAMSRHFPEGFLAGFKKKLTTAYWTALVSLIPLGVGGGFLASKVLFDTGPKDSTILVIIVGVVALLLLWGFIANLTLGIRLMLGTRRVESHLKTLDEDQLLGIAVSHYKNNKNSLAGSHGWARALLDRSKSR
jgi:hypothetical protein